MPMQMKIRFCLTAVLAGGGGWLAQQANIPLAWLIGSLLVTMLLGLRFPITVPRKLYRSGQIIVGTAVGLSVPPEVVDRIGPHVPTILAGALISIAIGRLLAPVVARASKLDLRTAFFRNGPRGDLGNGRSSSPSWRRCGRGCAVSHFAGLLHRAVVADADCLAEPHNAGPAFHRWELGPLLADCAADRAGCGLCWQSLGPAICFSWSRP